MLIKELSLIGFAKRQAPKDKTVLQSFLVNTRRKIYVCILMSSSWNTFAVTNVVCQRSNFKSRIKTKWQVTATHVGRRSNCHQTIMLENPCLQKLNPDLKKSNTMSTNCLIHLLVSMMWDVSAQSYCDYLFFLRTT